MGVVSVQHHPSQHYCSVATQTDDFGPAASYAATASPAATCAPVMEYVDPAPVVTYAAPAPVIEYIAPAPAVIFDAHGQRSPLAYTSTTDTTDDTFALPI